MAQRSGWAYGEVGGSGQWMTIVGSAYEAPALHATQEAAQAALEASPVSGWKHFRAEVAHVTEVFHGGVTGPRPYAYRVTQA